MEFNQTDYNVKDTEKQEFLIFRRPEPKDETDQIGREIVRRLIEAGVVEP